MQQDIESSPFARAVTKELNTIEDLAELAGVTPGTARWYVHAGRAPEGFKIAGGRRLFFTREAVIRWLEESHSTGRIGA